MSGTRIRNGEMTNPYRLLVRKPEEKRPLRRPRRILVNNIKMKLVGRFWDCVDWIGLVQDRDNLRTEECIHLRCYAVWLL
jgi:hypothetical protein